MNDLFSSGEYDFVSEQDKVFIRAFDAKLNALGYDCGEWLRPGFCWGRLQLVYTKTGLKTKNVVCRVYLREKSIAVRLYLKNIDAHRAYVEAAPACTKEAFINDFGRCGRCRELCGHRKTYTLDGQIYVKCDGLTFEFWNPNLERLPEYAALITEFYPSRGKA